MTHHHMSNGQQYAFYNMDLQSLRIFKYKQRWL